MGPWGHGPEARRVWSKGQECRDDRSEPAEPGNLQNPMDPLFLASCITLNYVTVTAESVMEPPPMENPFVYGEVVPAGAFVDRVEELARLSADLLAGQKVFLISPRRYGKSSLVSRALDRAGRAGALTIDVTVSSYSSYLAFLEGYAKAVLEAGSRWPRAITWLREAIGVARPEVRASSGPAGLAVAFPAVRTARDVARLAPEVFALPVRLAEARSRRVVVALDEFQAVGSFNGGSVEETLRAAVQHQRQVGYVFAGSEPTLMEAMVGPRRPFYKAGPVIRLQKIPAEPFAAFIEQRFSRSGMRPEAGLGIAVLDLAGHLPYDVQRLAHETWDDARAAGLRRVGLEHLHDTLRRLLAEHAVFFEVTWQRLTLAQRAVLRALVLEEGAGLLSADVRTRHRLGGASSVQAAIGALQRQDVVTRDGDRWVVVDSLMREWIARRTY
jgi:uncharacterized protein